MVSSEQTPCPEDAASSVSLSDEVESGGTDSWVKDCAGGLKLKNRQANPLWNATEGAPDPEDYL